MPGIATGSTQRRYFKRNDSVGRGLAPIARRALAVVLRGIAIWHRTRRDRHLLGRFNDAMLRDIGIDRHKVDDEDAAGFWRRR